MDLYSNLSKKDELYNWSEIKADVVLRKFRQALISELKKFLELTSDKRYCGTIKGFHQIYVDFWLDKDEVKYNFRHYENEKKEYMDGGDGIGDYYYNKTHNKLMTHFVGEHLYIEELVDILRIVSNEIRQDLIKKKLCNNF